MSGVLLERSQQVTGSRMLTAGHWFHRPDIVAGKLGLANTAGKPHSTGTVPWALKQQALWYTPLSWACLAALDGAGKAIFEEDCLGMSLPVCSAHGPHTMNLSGSFPPALPCPWYTEGKELVRGHTMP